MYLQLKFFNIGTYNLFIELKCEGQELEVRKKLDIIIKKPNEHNLEKHVFISVYHIMILCLNASRQ